MGFIKKEHVLKITKGFQGRQNNCVNLAYRSAIRSLRHQYTSRKLRKRDKRRLWIARINAGVGEFDLSYSRFIHAAGQSGINLNRKILASLAVEEPLTFKSIVEQVMEQTGLEPKPKLKYGEIAKGVEIKETLFSVKNPTVAEYKSFRPNPEYMNFLAAERLSSLESLLGSEAAGQMTRGQDDEGDSEEYSGEEEDEAGQEDGEGEEYEAAEENEEDKQSGADRR